MATINRKKLTFEISKNLGYHQNLINEIIGSLFEQIKTEYKKGNRIEIRGFGTFFPQLRKSKPYTDLNTLKKSTMPTKILLKFKSSKQNQI